MLARTLDDQAVSHAIPLQSSFPMLGAHTDKDDGDRRLPGFEATGTRYSQPAAANLTTKERENFLCW
jgi:hypothetical protein